MERPLAGHQPMRVRESVEAPDQRRRGLVSSSGSVILLREGESTSTCPESEGVVGGRSSTPFTGIRLSVIFPVEVTECIVVSMLGAVCEATGP